MTIKKLVQLFTLFTLFFGFGGGVVHNNVSENSAPILTKVNETYFVNGKEALDSSVLTPTSKNLSNPKVLLAEPKSSNWNMMSKSLSDGTIDFFYFDENNYSYRQFAYDDSSSALSESASIKQKQVANNDKLVECLKPETIQNNDGSISLYTPGFVPDSSNFDLSNDTAELTTFSVIGTDDRLKISNTNVHPYRTTGQIVMTYENVLNNKTGQYETLSYIGTGFLEGPDLLVTAGHCLYSDVTVTSNGDDSREDYLNNPRFPDSIYYYPAKNGSVNPYGGIKVNRIYLEDNYYLNTEKDWGCCKLSEPIGNKTGWLGKISNFYEQNYPLISFGYPGSKNGYMYQSSGIMTQFEDNGWYYRTTLDTEGGQSGSPYRVNVNNGDYVCGIHTYSVGNSYTGGIRIDGFMFAFMNSFVAGDLLYEITPDDYNFADSYPVDEETSTHFYTHELDNGLTFRTRRYRTGFIQGEYIVMSPIRPEIEKKEAFIEYSFNAPVNRIQVDLTYWREVSTEILDSDNGSAYLQVKNGDDWSNVFDLLSASTNLPTNRDNPTTYTIDFDKPIYVFRFYSEYHGNTFVYDANRGRLCIGNMIVWTEFDNYMPLNGSELEYQPDSWNGSSVGSYNCYAYALNTKNHGFMQPGQSEGHNFYNTDDYLSKDVLIDMVEIDSENYGFDFKPIGKFEQCDPGYYKVALVVDPDDDYHWYRQNYDGTWSHKPGGTNVTNLDNSNNVIYDPEICNRNSGYLNYSEFYGFFQVNICNMI